MAPFVQRKKKMTDIKNMLNKLHYISIIYIAISYSMKSCMLKNYYYLSTYLF